MLLPKESSADQVGDSEKLLSVFSVLEKIRVLVLEEFPLVRKLMMNWEAGQIVMLVLFQPMKFGFWMAH